MFRTKYNNNTKKKKKNRERERQEETKRSEFDEIDLRRKVLNGILPKKKKKKKWKSEKVKNFIFY